jgi:hypothetical protein
VEVTVLRGAEEELWNAWVHYEGLLPGLGASFDEAVRRGLEMMVQFPASAPIFAGDFRRLLLRRFDHGIFYRIHGTRLIVVAVLDLRQSTSNIKKRLGISTE